MHRQASAPDARPARMRQVEKENRVQEVAASLRERLEFGHFVGLQDLRWAWEPMFDWGKAVVNRVDCGRFMGCQDVATAVFCTIATCSRIISVQDTCKEYYKYREYYKYNKCSQHLVPAGL